LLRSLSDASAENVAAELVNAWAGFTPSQREDVVAVLLARPATTNALLEAISAGVITINDLSLDQRQSLRSHPDREIRRRAADLMSAAGAVVNADRQKVIEKYVAATHDTGDAVQGKLLFTKNCANCHKHSGEGQEIGPDLTGMAVHPKEELLIHILDPSRSVEGNFRRYTLLTTAGQVLSGMLAAESLSAVELIDAEGKRQSITRDDIEQLTSTNLSLMPEGFEQQLDVPQMTDLLEFLASKGRFVPIPLAGIATAVSDRPLFSNDRNGPDQMVFDDWGPKTFAGVPFQLIDPNGGKRANMIMLNGPNGPVPPRMPREVTLPCNMPVKAIHMLGGVSGWGYPYADEKTASVIVRLNYQDGDVEEHELLNGVHFADYIRRVDVPESQFAFRLRGQQLRYLAVTPKQAKPIRTIDLVKGRDETAPMIMAVTLEQVDK
jgi:putative heme-binding domain-containing protein